ncbi:MAG: N-acetylglucosamine-1-phosphate uridyltransferase / Glucosamine-1-phosphate N-acetyltransferase [uncultured Corynebacteriales bacterium]|uniref:Bifunctional protein GlmU n=1 Tax=uncultured Mycobacteriales bacterium TaxID=581187 RepID=A0A6J4IFJ0_9ACTN|nr:MAG: N-acetylglucosamine-1-phosphate uridyltransferase / Glucosamine-1-phosphate N-acetyltransferase [uncultured Corynebacteriales bacterium]
MTDARPTAVVVLAAGEGTRMRSATPKVLHEVAGRSLVGNVLAACAPLGADHTVVVVGAGRDAVTAHLAAIAPAAVPVTQAEQRGTGHAARVALDALGDLDGTVLVLPGDAPLLRTETLHRLVEEHQSGGAVATVLTAVLPDPTGYGRVLRRPDGLVDRIVEHRDATDAEREVAEVNTSVYAFEAGPLRAGLARLSTANAQGEEYLTDVVGAFVAAGRTVGAVVAAAEETAGVNDRVQLAAAHRTHNDRLLLDWMRAGVTVVDPATTWVDAEVELEPDVVLHPGVQLHGRTRVATGAEIGPDSTLTDTVVGAGAHVVRAHCVGARVGAGASVGPFAYLRPGAVLGEKAKVGTYVEVKGSELGPGAKVPHLSYIGDATIGAGSNLGAGTIVANYDGVAKHRTTVGEHVRVGSDTVLVAPVEVGDGAYVAAGSVITGRVGPGELGVARARQRNVPRWVARRRAGTSADKAARKAEEGR